MRLLQVSLRTLLLYSLILVLISIPISLLSIREILREEIDESLLLNTDQFLKHIKQFESLDDLETDLEVLDQLSYNTSIKPFTGAIAMKDFQTVYLFDSLEKEQRPFRQLSSSIDIHGKPYMLTVRMSMVDNNELVFAIGLTQVFLIVLLTVGLLLINRSLTKKLWKPFYLILDRLKAYELDKSQPFKFEKTNIIEFDDLNNTANHLVERSRKIYLQQKEFIENASHELQTPLAIFQSKLDNLMQSSSMMESDSSTILELEETAARMARLNKNLLLLSKIDNEQFTDFQLLELTELLKGVLSGVSTIAESQSKILKISLHPTIINANKTLIEVLLSNLIHNAIRHTEARGTIVIRLEGGKLEISNSGTPFVMDNNKIFERFTKEGATENSTGLGLAIVKKICDANSYKLGYQFRDNQHHFSVNFNVVKD